jgi:alkylation response protein AidB-like acyl-CoA dehydrogenase
MFQAVKHKAADMLVSVENARSATYFGAWEVAAGSDHAEVAAAVAKATATEHAVHVVGDAVQIHGGIAITWEHDLHLYLRRVKTDERMLGTPDEHLDLVADHVIGV